MNLKLRKRHRYMWMVMGIGLPLLCLEAIEGIPKNRLAQVPRHFCSLEFDSICGVGDSYEEQVIIKANKNNRSIQLVLKAPLKSAFTLVYVSDQQEWDDSAELIGSMNSMGAYEYTLNENLESKAYLLLVDKIKERTLYHQNLKMLE